MKTKGSLVKTIFISMITIAIVTILLLGVLMLHYEYVNFNRDSTALRDEYMEKQKATIKGEVDKVVDYIGYMKSKEKEALRDNLRAKTDLAYEIAMNIYNENKDSRGLDEIKKMVKDALRPIRYNGGRGYYFATRLDGVEELFADMPEMEGENLLNTRDTNGKYVIRDMIEIAKKDKEGIYEYTWTKPGQEGKDFSKVAYIRLFEPFNWFIGIGEYLDNERDTIQKLVLDRVAEIRFGNDGYIFVVSYEGVTLMNDTQRELIGENIWEITDPNGVKVIQEERKAVENPEGGFIQYQWKKPGGDQSFPKITFMKGIPDWGWMIGAGAYLDEIDNTIAENRKSLELRVRNQLIKVVLLLLFLITVTYITAKFIARRIDKSLVSFSFFFQRAAAESMEIDLKSVSFSEFEALALLANRMINQREQAERSLRESEEKYRTLFNMESDALVLVDIETLRILDANEAFSNLFGYKKEEIMNMREDSFSIDKSHAEGNTENAAYLPVRYRKKKDGTLFPCEINAMDFEYHGRSVRLLAVRDMSDRKRLEAQLRQAQKMEAIGTLAGGIAHDFNNVLLPIMGHTEMLMMGLPPDNHIQYNLKQIYEAGNRAKEMIRQILAFSRKDRQEKKPLKLGAVISDAVKLLRGSIPTTIDIQYVDESETDTILANATQIHQVILNLCTNAAHAMREKGGQLRIELNEFILGPGSSDKFRRLSEGRYLRITVRDTGTGIDPRIIDNIFEPYFTTKGIGEGTGMGLAVVHGIILDHKGDIGVESEPGKGATFTVLLPFYTIPDEVVKDIEPPGHLDIKKGHERILLVDDEKIVVDVLQDMLMGLGYEITARTSSIDALETFRNNPQGFDLVITDMTMPNMTGKDLAVEMLSIRPDTPIILFTGFSERIDEEIARAVGIKAFVMKPVVINELAKTIRDVLGM